MSEVYFMCFSDFSSCNLIGLASSLAISIGEDMDADELDVLAAFFTAFADNLAIIAAKKSMEEK